MDDIEEYRKDPIKFNLLSDHLQRQLLEKASGTTWDDFRLIHQPYPNSPYRKLHYDMRDPELGRNIGVIRSLIQYNLALGDWITGALVMNFFRVETHNVGRISVPETFQSFRKIFTFGCFGPNDDLKETNCQEWVYGHVGRRLLPYVIRHFTDAEFEIACSAIRSTRYSTREFTKILGKFQTSKISPIDGITPDIIDARSIKIGNIMAQKRLLESPNDSSLYVFASLWSRGGFVLPIPRPRWSRQQHRELTCGRFNRELRMVLLMQKFRYLEFSLHKDLIDTILGFLFDSYYEDLRQRIRQRNAKIREISTLGGPEMSKFLQMTGTEVIVDGTIRLVVNLSMGIPVGEVVLNDQPYTLGDPENPQLNARIINYCNCCGNLEDFLKGNIRITVLDNDGSRYISSQPISYNY